MRYLRQTDIKRAMAAMNGHSPTEYPNIDKTGSVRGMAARYGWVPSNCIRIGGYVYHLRPDHMDALRAAGLVRGD